MTRDELATRSEGGLQVVETAVDQTARIEKLLAAPDWLFRLRADPSVLTDEVEREADLAKAIAAVDRLKPSAVVPLSTARRRAAKLATVRLHELDVEPTADRLEDLLAQLVARGLDYSRERDRIARGWQRLWKSDRRRIAAMVGINAIGLATYAGLSVVLILPVAAIPVAVSLFGGLLVFLRQRHCPACGHRLDGSDRCTRCGQTPPTT